MRTREIYVMTSRGMKRVCGWCSGGLCYLCAGGPSMMILIQRICMALRGLGKFMRVAREMRVRAAILLQWWIGDNSH